MVKKSLTIERLKKKLRPIFKKNSVIKAVLFGSWARGTQSRKSDLDFIIVYNTRKRFLDRYDDFMEIYDALKGKAVDLLIYTPEELRSISKRKFISNALKQGVLLYGN